MTESIGPLSSSPPESSSSEIDPFSSGSRLGPKALWATAGFPHRGWELVGTEDLGEPQQICEACDFQIIRWVFSLRHEDWPEEIEVGCICAGHLTGDKQGMRDKENALKDWAARKRNFPTLAKWARSKNGTSEWIKYLGITVIVVDGYRVILKIPGRPDVCSRRRFKTPERAKLAAFDEMRRRGLLE